ncbi:hypothetical protein T484DRAFT_3640087 [Baffinella frigidus]|nr:hypothetical protein T484DRAFT_3640087 [Cryptophyta sp. CCMP2293]
MFTAKVEMCKYAIRDWSNDGRDPLTITARELEQRFLDRAAECPAARTFLLFARDVELAFWVQDCEAKDDADGYTDHILPFQQRFCSVNNAQNYTPLLTDEMLYWALSSEAERVLYRKYLFTARTQGGHLAYWDRFVELTNGFLRRVLGHKFTSKPKFRKVVAAVTANMDTLMETTTTDSITMRTDLRVEAEAARKEKVGGKRRHTIGVAVSPNFTKLSEAFARSRIFDPSADMVKPINAPKTSTHVQPKGAMVSASGIQITSAAFTVAEQADRRAALYNKAALVGVVNFSCDLTRPTVLTADAAAAKLMEWRVKYDTTVTFIEKQKIGVHAAIGIEEVRAELGRMEALNLGTSQRPRKIESIPLGWRKGREGKPASKKELAPILAAARTELQTIRGYKPPEQPKVIGLKTEEQQGAGAVPLSHRLYQNLC